MDDALTDRQLRFIFEYLLDFNASAAAARAGYAAHSRAAQAHALMNNPAVQARLRLEIQGLLAEAGCHPMALIRERKRGAFFRPRNMFKSGWEPLPLDEMEEETRQALEVNTVMRKSGPVIRVRQPDRDKSLRALERVHERLDRLNEKRWAQLEREGRMTTSPEEIDAMDQGSATQAPAETAEATRAQPRFERSDAQISRKNYGFIREKAQSRATRLQPGPDFSAGTMVLSGSPPAQVGLCFPVGGFAADASCHQQYQASHTLSACP